LKKEGIMAAQKVLVPSKLSLNDEKSLNFVIQRFVDKEDVEVTLFNAYNPVPEIDVRNNPIMEKMSKNLSYQRQRLDGREAKLNTAKNMLLSKGFKSDRVHCLFKPLKKDVARDIVSLVREKGYNMVVLNRDRSQIARFFTKSIFEKVSAKLKKEVTVFVVN